MKDLRILKVDELKDIAREYGIVGAWKKTKDVLIDNILKAAEGNGHTDRYYDSSLQNESEEVNEESIDETVEESQDESESTTEESQKNNGWEEIAKKQLYYAYNWIVGENENAVSDGEMTNDEFNKWIQNEAINDVYHEAITTEYGEGYCGGSAPTEMRFAGKDFCYKYLARLFKKDGYKIASKKLQDEPCGTLKAKSDKLSIKKEKPTEQPSNASKRKSYGAWVVDRETKELTIVVEEADSREDFYNSIKTKYRVRLITKPEKLEEECKQWEIKHAQNKIKKNEKYATDKIEAEKMKMNVAEYRKYLRESTEMSK